MFYDRFYELCNTRNVTPTQVAREIGIGQSTVSMWKKQGTTPNAKTVTKLAEYFGVAEYYLLGYRKTGVAPDGTELWTDPIHADDPNWTKGATLITMIGLLDNLNILGQQKAIERVEELTEIPKYQKKDTPEDE